MISRTLSFGLVAISWLTMAMLANVAEAKTEKNIKIEVQEERIGMRAESVMAQAAAAEITDIQVSQTAAGVNVTLVSAEALSVGTSSTSGNALIIEVPNAMLNLVDAAAAEQFGPAEGIAVVSVTEGVEGQVQIAITGTDALPVAEVTTDSQGLVLAVELGDAEAVASSDEETIRLVVTAATRVEASTLDVPQSIQVIPREVLEGRAVNSVVEALRTSPGVISSFDNSLFNSANIRGFAADFRRNGLTNGVIGRTSGLPNNIERIEILRGPASVLYGQGSFGGTVNVITEKPTDAPFYSLDATVGNFDRYGAALDLSGPVNGEGTVKYRLNLAAETEGGFIDDASRQRFLVAPVLAWAPNENTDINFEVEYTNLTAENNFGLPAKGTVLPNINGELDRDRYVGDADIENREIDSLTIGYDFEHRFNDNWRIHNAAQYTFRASPEFSLDGVNLQDDERTLERIFAETNEFDIRNYLFETYAVGDFNTGSIEHELLAGIESLETQIDADIVVGSANPIDLFAPEMDTVILGPATDFFLSESTDRSLGIYLQDRINFTNNLILLLGGRFDIISSDFTDFSFDSSGFFQEEEFSPRVGLVYQPTPELALYTNYSRSFIPNTFGFASDGGAFPPQRGTQFEVGVKANINDKLSLTLAYFDVSVTNVTTADPEDVNFQVITGEQSSQGVELFASGEILPGWNIIGGYTYNDAKITESNDFPVGNRIPNNPRHAASLFTTYEIQQGNLEGLGFGLGLFYVGEREGDFFNSFEVPDYLRTDASIFYQRDRFRAALNVENLFDDDYFENVESDLRVRPGAPFTVRASVSWDF